MLNTPETAEQNLSGVSETLLLPLYFRAIESQRPDALIRDEIALELVQQMSFDFTRLKHAQHDEESQVAVILRNRQFDRITRNFLAIHKNALVVSLGCGLDARFERVDNGQVEWYDLDLPEVIALRRQVLGDEAPRYHLLPYSLFDESWLNEAELSPTHSILFLAEGVLMYFEQAQVEAFVKLLQSRFPSAELVFDAFSPFYVWANNRRVARTHFGSLAHWGLKDAKALEHWGSGMCLVEEYYPYLSPEPRLAHIHWVRFLPFLAKTMGVFHYKLGD